MSTSPGWYPDPAPESAPGALRWWDGRTLDRADPARPGASSPRRVQQQVQLTKPTGYQAQPVPAGYQGARATRDRSRHPSRRCR